MRFGDYIKQALSRGKYAITLDEIVSDLGVSHNAALCGIHKLKEKGEIIRPARKLYVIVPPEYQRQGSLPAEDLAPILMEYLGISYYACGLTSAYYYGASHQKPQVFQIMAGKRLREMTFGKIKITFTYKHNLNDLYANYTKKKYINNRVVKTGYLKVASPELTTLDLLTYQSLSGGLNPTATVLNDLCESIQASRLLQLVQESPVRAWWQRLGYILEYVCTSEENTQTILAQLKQYAKTQNLTWNALNSSLPTAKCERDNFWKIVKNTTIEVDG
jgi:predicted transcriptional regulator of viral defense system